MDWLATALAEIAALETSRSNSTKTVNLLKCTILSWVRKLSRSTSQRTLWLHRRWSNTLANKRSMWCFKWSRVWQRQWPASSWSSIVIQRLKIESSSISASISSLGQRSNTCLASSDSPWTRTESLQTRLTTSRTRETTIGLDATSDPIGSTLSL